MHAFFSAVMSFSLHNSSLIYLLKSINRLGPNIIFNNNSRGPIVELFLAKNNRILIKYLDKYLNQVYSIMYKNSISHIKIQVEIELITKMLRLT